ncbi:flocculation-associated PEP-CTERM protein PepA [Nitrosomonas nitrosa]|uniref:flocculation-associated PEP-CTERM protein PepA n=1 Tax=Nitrosomonas nitrosa TaxID=52442 RepID=UPI000D489B0D|nr:flocculation-associated PEP-CTERM protein PepA [Nitrosomonas nitrosa]
MKKLISTAVAMAFVGGAAVVHAAATLDTTTATPNDGILQNFVGIDWHNNGGAWIQGFDLTTANNTGDSDTFTLTYQAFAGVINTSSLTPNLYVASPGAATGSYELTTFATLNETATCLNNGCTSISITTDSGFWDVFFDISPDANQSAGTGFLDGVSILSGTFTGGLSTFIATGPIPQVGVLGTGGGFIIGNVTNTNNAYINPDLLGTTFQASLQFPGQSSPTYTRPAAFNGVATGADTASSFVIQTDASQNFTVPEPTSLALFGIGLLGLSLVGRRRFNN